MNVIFEADLPAVIDGRRIRSAFVTDINGTLVPRGDGRWLMAVQFVPGRVMLVGDSAHVMPPTGGFGGNTGIQDAYNLAWKLTLVVQGRANAALLDTYEEERIPVAQRLLRTTDRAFQLVVTDNWIASLFRTKIIARIAARAMTVRRVRNVAFRTISQIGIRYRKSRLSQTLAGLPEGAPRAGDRFPWLKLRFSANGPLEDLFQKLDDTRFNLLVVGQPPPSAETLGLGELLHIHAITNDPTNWAELARVGVSGPAFYLLRPDGHVGLAGTRLDPHDVKRYLAERHIRVDAETRARPH